MERLSRALLYGILDLGYVDAPRAEDVTEQLLLGGVGVLQLRAKGWDVPALLPLASSIAARCRATGVPFIINDFPDMVPMCGADGVHVGQDDMSVAHARALAGGAAIVGKSTHSPDQAMAATKEGADYIGFGPLFATPTKPDYTPVGLGDIVAVHRTVGVPVFCIGGVKPHNLPEVLAAGAHRVVIVSALLQATDIVATCRECVEVLMKNRG